MPTRNPSPPPDENASLAERAATELRRIGHWALWSAVQAEMIPPGADEPLYDKGETDEPRNTAARLESHLRLLLEEYLEPAKREMARVAGILHTWRKEKDGADDRSPFLLPELETEPDDDALAITTLSMTLPSEHLVAAFAEFARAAGDHHGIDVKTIEEGRQLALVVVPGSADKAAVRQCLSLLLEPWATTQRRV